MESQGILPIILLTIAVFAVILGAGAMINKMPPDTVRNINWFFFAVAILSGLASYSIGDVIYRYIFMGSLIAYFLTIRYKTE